jgi:protein TorT
MKQKIALTLASSIFALVAAAPAFAESWYPYPAQAIEPAFAADGKSVDVSYSPVEKAEKPWNICVSFPHMKDAYWLGVDYGVAEQAKDAGVKMNLVEAGGYTELNKNIPVIDVINGISSPDVTAKSLVSFYTMGFETGSYLAKKHPAGSEEVKVGWFPGPAGAGWVEAANKGFLEAIKGSAVVALEPKYGDTGKEVQLKLVEDALQANPDLRYIAGTAVTAEAAQGLIRERGLQGKVDLLAFYMTPGVYEGIKRGFILAAPADSMVIQGRIAIDQAIRALEGKELVKHVGPKIFVVDPSNIANVPQTNILPPDGYKPVFSVN